MNPDKTHNRRPRSRWMLLSVAAIAIVALLAIPAVAFANAPGSPDPQGEPRATVADCRDHADTGEFPRMTDFLAGLVADNVISQDQSDEIDARFREEVEYNCIAHILFPKRSAIGVTADVTGTRRIEVLRGLRDGDSLAGYAADHGVAEADLIDALMAGPQDRAAEMVANNEITQEESDELLADVETYVTELIHAEGIDGFRHTRW